MHRHAMVGLALAAGLPLGCDRAAKDAEHRLAAPQQQLDARVGRKLAILGDARARAQATTHKPAVAERGPHRCLFLDPPKDSAGTDLVVPYDEEHGFPPCEKIAHERPGDLDIGEQKLLQACLATRWLLVLAPRSVSAPKDHDPKQFVPGVYEGDVHVYDFATGEYTASGIVRATNSRDVEIGRSSRAENSLFTDLLRNTCAQAGLLVN